jgi:hypothetical protein
MQRTILLALFLLCFITGFSQVIEDKKLVVSGIVKDSLNNPVPYARIQVKNGSDSIISDYYGTFHIPVIAGDTISVSAPSFNHYYIVIPKEVKGQEYITEVIMKQELAGWRDLVKSPWPATYEEFKAEFMKIEIVDPLANLDLHLPSPEELRNYAYPQGGIVIQGPISFLYDQFSKEARSKKLYAELVVKEKAGKRYNKELVAKITGLKNDDQIKKFMEFCSLQIRFILESTDYELYAAILDCYKDYCSRGFEPDSVGN